MGNHKIVEVKLLCAAVYITPQTENKQFGSRLRSIH
jgi:hypothetical protein